MSYHVFDDVHNKIWMFWLWQIKIRNDIYFQSWQVTFCGLTLTRCEYNFWWTMCVFYVIHILSVYNLFKYKVNNFPISVIKENPFTVKLYSLKYQHTLFKQKKLSIQCTLLFTEDWKCRFIMQGYIPYFVCSSPLGSQVYNHPSKLRWHDDTVKRLYNSHNFLYTHRHNIRPSNLIWRQRDIYRQLNNKFTP